MKHYMSGELFKWKKSLSFKVCLLIVAVLGLISIGTLVMTSKLYKTETMQKQLYVTYQAQGMSDVQIQETIDKLVSPSGMSQLPENLGGFNLLIIMGIFAVLFLASDYHNGTIRQIVSRGYSKHSVFIGKITVVFMAALILLAVSVLIPFLTASILFRVGTGPEHMAAYVVKYVVTLLLTAAAYTSVTSFFAILTKNVGGSIGCIVVLPILGNLLAVLLEIITKYKYSFSNYWFTNTPSIMVDFSLKTSEYLKYAGTMLGVTIVFGFLGYVVFRRQEC